MCQNMFKNIRFDHDTSAGDLIIIFDFFDALAALGVDVGFWVMMMMNFDALGDVDGKF